MKEIIEHRVINEDPNWVLGKTYVNNTYFGDWCKYKKGGIPPTIEQLKAKELARAENAHAYRLSHPHTSTPEYYAAIKRYPLKEK